MLIFNDKPIGVFEGVILNKVKIIIMISKNYDREHKYYHASPEKSQIEVL